MTPRLTPAQRTLLAGLSDNADTGYADGGWWIRTASRPERTVRVLMRHGLARSDEPGHYVITDAGSAHLDADNRQEATPA